MSLKTVAAWQPDSPAGSTDYSHKHAAIQKKLPSLQANKSAPVQRVSSFALIAENSISVCFFFQVLWEPESLYTCPILQLTQAVDEDWPNFE